jgi:hypothetical protein
MIFKKYIYTYIHTYIHTQKITQIHSYKHILTQIHIHKHKTCQDGGRRERGYRERSKLNSVYHRSSGYMKKELKNIIFDTVSNLRKLFAKLIDTNENNNRKITQLEKNDRKHKGGSRRR